MKELIDYIKEWTSERVTNPFLRYFTFYYILFNWKFIIVLFVDSEEMIAKNTEMLKSEYLFSLNQYPNSEYTWIWIFLASLSLACLSIWVLPIFFNFALKMYTQHRAKARLQRHEVNFEIEKQIFDERKELADKVKNALEAEKKLEKVDEKIVWKKEFEEFKREGLYGNFNSYYKYISSTAVYMNSDYTNTYSDIHALCDAYDLLDIVPVENSSALRVKFNKKGNYFARLDFNRHKISSYV